MAHLEQRTFQTDCPAELITAVNEDAEIGTVLDQIINDGGLVTNFWFQDPLDVDETTAFDAILATWDCDDPDNEPPPDPGELAIYHKRDKIAGIVNRGASWMDFDFNTNELTLISNPTLAPDITEFEVWSYNTPYKKSTDSIIVPTDSPNYLIYYNEAGELYAIPTDSNDDEITNNAAIIARTSVDTVKNETLLILDLRYDVDMDPETRNTFIKTVGATYDSGLALLDIIADGSGNDDAHAQFSVQDGNIFLADILYKTTARSQTLTFPAQIPIWYLIGQEWHIKEGDNFPMIYEGSVGSDYTGTRLPYNSVDSNGDGSLVEVRDKHYICCHYFAAPGLYRSIVGVQGQFDYNKKDEARRGAEKEVSQLLSSESVSRFYTPIATVIYQTASNKNNTPHAEIVSYVGDSNDRHPEEFDYYDLRQLKAALGSGAGTPTPVVDALDSTSVSNGLSANMGRVLNEKFKASVEMHFFTNS